MAEAATEETLHFLDYWRVLRSRKEIVLAVSLLIIVTGVIVTYALPKVYRSSVVIQVKQETPDLPVFTPEMMRFDPLFLRTQFQVIQSGPVIEEVVRSLNLAERLGRAYGYYEALGEQSYDHTIDLITRALKVQQYRDTNLIEVQIYLRELGGQVEEAPRVASDIAKAIYEVYRSRSSRRSREVTERALQALHESLLEQKQRVREAEQEVERIRAQEQIDVLRATAGSDAALRKLTLTTLESHRVRIRMDYAEQKSKYEKVMSLPDADVVPYGIYALGDTVLASLLAEKRRAEVEKDRFLRAALGAKHPDVVSVQAVINELDAKIADAVQGLKTGLQADFEAAQSKVAEIERQLDELKDAERTAEATQYRDFDRAMAELEHQRKVAEMLEMRYLQERIEQRIPRTTVELIEPPKPPAMDDWVSPNFPLNILLSVLVGLTSGIGLAYFVEYLDTSVKTIEDVERHMGLPVVGVIPQRVKPFVDDAAEGGHHEAFRMLRTNVQLSDRAREAKVFCVTSGSVGEGKSLTILNLAYICAKLGDRVLLVDADLHRPRQHKMLKMSNRIGLANVLTGETELEDAIVPSGVDKLDMLPSGKIATGVHGLLDSPKMRELIKLFRERYDIVFFDAPPMIGVSDTSLLVREMDGVLLVIQHRKYPRAVSGRAKDMVLNVGGNIVGVVLNNINIARDYSYYYHHYYYYPQYTQRERAVEGRVSESGKRRRS